METPVHRQAFGRRLRELRAEGGWTSQEAFALHAGLDRTYVSGIESGRRNPTLDVLVRVAGALNVPVSELFTLVTVEMGVAARAASATS
ncbi:helix-turn-helix domain-containing protein [Leucobacter sp. NPDC058333]|uniref:helix-turn-helix domain-containing protein n=1 Tax=Leucobacter sp. NPDC058333 TaxID=3346450 RepID=UPI00364BF93E